MVHVDPLGPEPCLWPRFCGVRPLQWTLESARCRAPSGERSADMIGAFIHTSLAARCQRVYLRCATTPASSCGGVRQGAGGRIDPAARAGQTLSGGRRRPSAAMPSHASLLLALALAVSSAGEVASAPGCPRVVRFAEDWGALKM